MVKTAVDLNTIVERFVDALQHDIVVERVILSGDYAREAATDDSDIWLLVISPSFEEMNWFKQGDLLAMAGLNVDTLIQSWGFTPSELRQTLSGEGGGSPFLGMMLNQSREIYASPAARTAQENRDD